MTKTKTSLLRPTAGSPGVSVLQVGIADFQAGMQKFAAMFADSYGLRLEFKGTMAYTDGTLIVVPELSLLARPNMTPAEVQEALDFLTVTRGYVYHEGAHVLFSDFNVAAEAHKVSPKFKLLVNMLEDNRIELRVADIYPGAKQAIRDTNEWTIGQVADVQFADGKTRPSEFVQFIYAVGMIGNLDPDACTWPLWDLLDEDTRTLARGFRAQIMQARKAPDTATVAVIAREIWEVLCDKEREKEEEEKKREKAKTKTPPTTEKAPKKKAPKKKAPKKDPTGEDEEPADGDPGEGAGSWEDEEPGEGDPSEGSGDAPGEPDGEPDAEDPAGDARSAPGDGDGDAEDEEPGDAGSAPGEAEDDRDPEAGDPGDGTTTGGHGAPPPRTLLGDPDETPMDKATAVERKATAAAVAYAASGARDYRVYTTENDTVGPPEVPTSLATRQRLAAQVSKLTDELRSSFGPVKRQLENLLKARTQSYYVRGLDAGQLDPASLHKLASASRTTNPHIQAQARLVFQERVQAAALTDTAVTLLIDQSGSMGSYAGNDTRDVMAQKCALVFAHALDGVKVPFEVLSYTSAPHYTSDAVLTKLVRAANAATTEREACTVHVGLGIGPHGCPARCESHGGRVAPSVNATVPLYTRFGGLRITEVKTFAEQWSVVDWRITQVTAYHANYDAESVLLASRRLMARKEKRKVLFVLTDGLPGPDVWENHNLHAEYLHQVMAEVRTSTPVEVVGIGICAPEAGQFYKPNFINVPDASDLPRVVADQLKRVLLR